MVKLMELTSLLEPRWEAILLNKTKEASINSEETRGTIRIQEDTGSLMVEMEPHNKGQDPTVEVLMGDQISSRQSGCTRQMENTERSRGRCKANDEGLPPKVQSCHPLRQRRVV